LGEHRHPLPYASCCGAGLALSASAIEARRQADIVLADLPSATRLSAAQWWVFTHTRHACEQRDISPIAAPSLSPRGEGSRR
jgi:hypothetical protein